MINITNLTKTYGSKTIIKDWSYEFEDNKIYGLIGRNGIGKTTLMKCMCGLIAADQSKTDNGKTSQPKNYLTSDIYYVSDEPVYYNDLTLKEHLWLVAKVEKYSKDEAQQKIDALVSKYKMQEYMNYFPTAMSKGTIQRMMLMMAFLRKADNLLLDEPFNGLDPIQLQQSLELIKETNVKDTNIKDTNIKDTNVNNSNGKCIVISSHDIESLEEVCDVFLIFTKDGIKEIIGSVDRAQVNEMIGDSYD